MTEQIRFYVWGDPEAPKDYFKTVGLIAHFIGCALQHPNPKGNSARRRHSTIQVFQTKEKFGAAIVYCTLGDKDEIQSSWEEHGNQGLYTEEFALKCLEWDKNVYVDTYKSMIKLVPQYEKAILDGTNFPDLLKEIKNES